MTIVEFEREVFSVAIASPICGIPVAEFIAEIERHDQSRSENAT
jgi:hypothetical protein